MHPPAPGAGPDPQVEARTRELLRPLPLRARTGLMFQTMAVPGAPLFGRDPTFGLPGVGDLLRRGLTHFNLMGPAPAARDLAGWINEVQALALRTGAGLPVSFSSDPRHSFTENLGTSACAGPFSQWPEPIGLAALDDPATVRLFADVVRQEYRAVGIVSALHPQVDVATEPRWSRVSGTFGEDPRRVARLGVEYVCGLQGGRFGPGSVQATVKHFPGGGPQLDGEDPHFPYGKDQVYPGGRFDDHLLPFAAAVAAGARAVMPYYGRPVGLVVDGEPVPEVGFAFNAPLLQGVLRRRLGFEGVVLTDWGVLTDVTFLGRAVQARAWGLEHLDRDARAHEALRAGVDQFGGEACPAVLDRLVTSGRVTARRIETSAHRLLREKVALGLVDDPFVDPDAASAVVGAPAWREAGLAAQSACITVLDVRGGPSPGWPLPHGLRVHAVGLAPASLPRHGLVAADLQQADVAVVRVEAPYQTHDGPLDQYFHVGPLEFDDAELRRLLDLCRTVPTVLDVHLDRPAVLTGLLGHAAVLLASYGACDDALLHVVRGRVRARGRLPFDLPASTADVAASPTDAPFALARPLLRAGHRVD